MSLSDSVPDASVQPGHYWTPGIFRGTVCWEISLGDIWLRTNQFKYNDNPDKWYKGYAGHNGCLNDVTIVTLLYLFQNHRYHATHGYHW